MALTIPDIAADVTAGALAISRVIKVLKPFWGKLPTWLAVVLPVFVLDLPQIAAVFAPAATGTDLITATVTSLALLLPGIEIAESSTG